MEVHTESIMDFTCRPCARRSSSRIPLTPPVSLRRYAESNFREPQPGKTGREFRAAQPRLGVAARLPIITWRVKRYRDDTMDLEMLNERTG
jgi:hypothetical protein